MTEPPVATAYAPAGRTERSLEALNVLVDHLDHEALAGGVPVSRRLVAPALRKLFAVPADEEAGDGEEAR